MADAVNLEELKAEIDSIGERVKSLKTVTGEVDKDAIAAAVKDLVTAKKKFADNNNGIGVDGKPFEEPMTKAQKKAKAKNEDMTGPSKPVADPDSKGAQKKAAKKAEAKAKKSASKEDGVTEAGAPGKVDAPAVVIPKPAFTKPTSQSLPPVRMATKIQPMQILINPNSLIVERPLVTLAVAIMTNTLLDYELVSDHLSRHSALGLPHGGAVVGDFAMARYVLRRADAAHLMGGPSPSQQAVLDAWVDYSQSIYKFETAQKIAAVAMTLEHALQGRTYLVGQGLTMADICLFGALGFPAQHEEKEAVLLSLPQEASIAKRWIKMMAESPAIMQATQLAVGIAGNAEAVFEEQQLEPLADGMNYLEGAIAGRVVTRFPPEPSGYLHIGHAKAVLLNDYYARRYQGRLICRFDDTNPSKEKEEYQASIIEDLAKLDVKPDLTVFTSDYFETLRGFAEFMIQNGTAYMDDTPQEQMKEERMQRQNSKHRNQEPSESMKLFKDMCSGSEEGGKWCLRAKIDMQSVNGTMRDPVLFRQNLTPHHRTGTTFKAYPTYDLACPIVDSLEGVTHALRTTEYNDRDEQYQWIQSALKLRPTRIHGFARINFTNTVMSKRKLTWFVDTGNVTGWDDPRFPTVRGVVRRGIDITALRNFMYSQGASRRVVTMEWSKFWAENKKEIDKTAKRFMAIDKEKHMKLIITNGPEGSSNAFLTTDRHPKIPELGKRIIRLSKEVLLESVDAESIELGELIVLIRWGVFKVTKVDGSLEAIFVPDGNFKEAKKKLSWLADVPTNTKCILTEFDNLLTKDRLEEEDNFEDYINPNTIAETEVIGDALLKTLQQHDIVQLERRGYYRVDRPYLSEEKPLMLFMVPDGKTKAMGGLAGKLAHR